MAGRKATPKQDILTTLRGMLGLQQPAKKGKKKKKKGPPRPRPAEGSFEAAYAAEASPPFGDYGAESGMGFDETNYEAAAAAGYAPPVASHPEPALPAFEDEPMPAFGAPEPPQAQASAMPADDGKLFSMDALDSSLDAIFSNLEAGGPEAPAPEPVKENIVAFPSRPVEPAPVAAAPPPPPPPPPVAPKMPEPIMPKAVEPEPATMRVPVSAPVPPARPVSEPASFARLDASKLPDVLPLATGVDLRALLEAVDRVRGVAGTLLVGHDGLIIASTLPPELDEDYMGAQACNVFTGNTGHTQKMGRGDLRRIVLETSKGVMLMTAADMGILVVVSEDGQMMDMPAVAGAIAGALPR